MVDIYRNNRYCQAQVKNKASEFNAYAVSTATHNKTKTRQSGVGMRKQR